MRPVVVSLLTLSLVPCCAFAQRADKPPVSGLFEHPGQTPPRTFQFNFNQRETPAIVSAARAPGCPVSMIAEQRSAAGMMDARSANPGGISGRTGVAQRIHLQVENHGDTPTIASVRVTVHGTDGRARVVPIGAESASSNAARSFDLPTGGSGMRRIATDLMLTGFTSVQSVSVDAITYADGSGWIAPTAGSCSVAPNPLMLIGTTLR